MIEVLLNEGSTPIVVGEAEDLKGITLLTLDPRDGAVGLETLDASRRPLGTLSDKAIEGLGTAGQAIIAALHKNTLAWAIEVDVGTFRNEPRRIVEIELRALADSMGLTGFYAEEARPPTGRKPGRRTERPKRRQKD